MILYVSELCKEYSRGKYGFEAVNKVNLRVEEGDFISVTGHSGSGKTTLFNMIAGLIRPTSGSVTAFGQEVAKMQPRELARYRNEDIGYILQGQNLLSNFTILDNVCMPAYLSSGKRSAQEWGMHLLERVGVSEMASEKPSSLSGGELRRVCIARAMINKPRLVIADEPTGNLDPENKKKIMSFLKEMNEQGTTVLVSTHDMEFLKYTGKNYEMKQGVLT